MLYPGQKIQLCKKCQNPFFELKKEFLFEDGVIKAKDISPVQVKCFLVCSSCGEKLKELSPLEALSL